MGSCEQCCAIGVDLWRGKKKVEKIIIIKKKSSAEEPAIPSICCEVFCFGLAPAD